MLGVGSRVAANARARDGSRLREGQIQDGNTCRLPLGGGTKQARREGPRASRIHRKKPCGRSVSQFIMIRRTLISSSALAQPTVNRAVANCTGVQHLEQPRKRIAAGRAVLQTPGAAQELFVDIGEIRSPRRLESSAIIISRKSWSIASLVRVSLIPAEICPLLAPSFRSVRLLSTHSESTLKR